MYTANFPRSVINESYGKFPFYTDDDDWLISIRDPATYPVDIKPRFGRVLELEFLDVDLLKIDGGFSPELAEETVRFIAEAKKLKKNVWVHCHAGVCRSGAIVEFLIDQGWKLKDHELVPGRVPNPRVYSLLHNAKDIRFPTEKFIGIRFCKTCGVDKMLYHHQKTDCHEERYAIIMAMKD